MHVSIIGSIITFFTIVISWCLWFSLQWLVLDNCDPKFGCIGGIQFALFFSAIGGLVSSFSFAAAAFLPWRNKRSISRKYFISTGIVGGAVLSVILPTVLSWGGGDIVGLVFMWFVLSVVIFDLAFRLLNRLAVK